MNNVYLAVGVLALGVVSLTVLGAFAVLTWVLPGLRRVREVYDSALRVVNDRLQIIEGELERLPRELEEYSKDATKTLGRAKWHARRVKKELQERGLADEEIDALDSSLRQVDGNGSGESQLQLLQSPVEEIPGPPQVENWRTKALRKKWNHG